MEDEGKQQADPADSESESYWTPERKEILSWLNDRAPSFVEGYKSAVGLLHMPRTFPARVHLFCHLIRDFYRRLPSTLGVKSGSRPGEIFPNMVKTLKKLWDVNPPTTNGESATETLTVLMSIRMYNHLRQMVATSEKLRKTTVGQLFAQALYRSMEHRQTDFIPPWVISSFDSEYDFFVDRAHIATTVEGVPSDDGLTEHFHSFEKAFHALVGSYSRGKEELDEILQDTNTTAD